MLSLADPALQITLPQILQAEPLDPARRLSGSSGSSGGSAETDSSANADAQAADDAQRRANDTKEEEHGRGRGCGRLGTDKGEAQAEAGCRGALGGGEAHAGVPPLRRARDKPRARKAGLISIP
eukprot:634497-Rhodomonas_salina.1